MTQTDRILILKHISANVPLYVSQIHLKLERYFKYKYRTTFCRDSNNLIHLKKIALCDGNTCNTSKTLLILEQMK